MLLNLFNIYMLHAELTEFGLSEPEAHVYVAGLELGPCSILEIAKKTKQNRTSLYHTIQQLLDAKLFTVTVRGKKKMYVAEPPEILKHQQQIKMKRLDGILDELSGLTHTGTFKPVIKFYEGLEGIKTVFMQSLACKEKTLYAVAGIQRLNVRSKALLDFWLNDFGPSRIENGITTKLIAPDTEQGLAYKKTDVALHRETRLLPASTYNFESEYLVYDNVLNLFVYSEHEQFAISITSQAIAQTMKLLWRIAWNQGWK